MKRSFALLALVCALASAGGVQAQTRADSAAVLLHAAEQLRLQGETAAARALLEYLERHYGGTAAAVEAQRARIALRRVQQERPGRVELLVGGTTYGAWLGLAVPLMLDSDEPEAYGLGFLAGAPVGFLAARAYAQRRQPTEGQARAITFGGFWGTVQGFGWAEVLGIGDREETVFCDVVPGGPCIVEDEADMPTRVAVAVAGGLAGIGTGAWLARKPITAGTAAAASTSALWAGWFGFGLAYIADMDDNAVLASALAAGNAALVGSALLAPGWQVTESRVRLISIGGIIGGLTGVGILLLVQPDDARAAMSIPVATSAAGLALGIVTTRDRAAGAGSGAAGQGALLNVDRGRWALDVPAASLRLERGARGAAEPAAYVPLLRMRLP